MNMVNVIQGIIVQKMRMAESTMLENSDVAAWDQHWWGAKH